MKTIKVEGLSRNLPEKWEEVDFKTFVGLVSAKDKSNEILSLLIGIPVDTTTRIEGLEIVLRTVNFLKKEPPIDEKPVSIGSFIFPQDITFETIEQYEEVRSEIQRVQGEDITEQTKAMAYYAAVYCVKRFTPIKARELAEEFLNYPCLEVLSAGSFFQAKCLSMESGLSMTYLRKNTLLRKNRPGLDRLMRRLASMLRLTPLRDTSTKVTKK